MAVAQLPFSAKQKSVEAMVSHIAHLRSVQKPERLAAFDLKTADSWAPREIWYRRCEHETSGSGSSQQPLDPILKADVSPFCMERSEEISSEPENKKSQWTMPKDRQKRQKS